MAAEILTHTGPFRGQPPQPLADARQPAPIGLVPDASDTRRLPGCLDVAIRHRAALPRIPLVGTIAAGSPLEPFPPADLEQVEVPRSMVGRGTTFALRVKGDSMRDDGILPGDVVVVRKQTTARNGQTVIALVNGEATIKIYRRTGRVIELQPANDTMRPIVVKETDRFRIEGIVVGVIRHLRT